MKSTLPSGMAASPLSVRMLLRVSAYSLFTARALSGIRTALRPWSAPRTEKLTEPSGPVRVKLEASTSTGSEKRTTTGALGDTSAWPSNG